MVNFVWVPTSGLCEISRKYSRGLGQTIKKRCKTRFCALLNYFFKQLDYFFNTAWYLDSYFPFPRQFSIKYQYIIDTENIFIFLCPLHKFWEFCEGIPRRGPLSPVMGIQEYKGSSVQPGWFVTTHPLI